MKRTLNAKDCTDSCVEQSLSCTTIATVDENKPSDRRKSVTSLPGKGVEASYGRTESSR